MKNTKLKKGITMMLLMVVMFQATTIKGNAASPNTSVSKTGMQKNYEESLMKGIEKSTILDEDNYEIRVIKNNENIDNKGKWITCNTVKEAIKYLENTEMQMTATEKMIVDIEEEDIEIEENIKGAAKTKSVTKSYSRGVAPKYTLKATFKYDTKTKKIKSVTGRKFTLSGITLVIGAEDKTYSTKYSSDRKKATVKCSYTAVSYLITPVGRIEIERKDAYQKFSYSVSKGVTGGKGGYE